MNLPFRGGPVDEEVGVEAEPGAVAEPLPSDALAAIADAVNTQADVLEDPALAEPLPVGHGGGSRGYGRGLGRGAGPGGRGLGHGPGRGGGIARQWEVYFIEGNTLEGYARQLDFFKIELGVLMPNNQVAYATNLSQPRPSTRTGQADLERRYYLTWRGGNLIEADRELLARAGIDTTGRIILKFLPPELEAQLLAMERQRAGDQAKSIRRTRFGVRPGGSGGYSFVVLEQTYR